MGRRRTSDELASEVAGLAEEIRQRAIDETRADLARAIEDQFVGRPGLSRREYGWTAPQDSVLEVLAALVAEGRKLPAPLAAVAAKAEDDGVPPGFVAGLLFATQLMADPQYDY